MKKERGRKKLALWLGLFSTFYALAGQTVHAGPPVGFRLVKNSLVVIPVRVNEEGPFDFLLDTGTNVTLVTPALARRLDLGATSQVSLITLAGTELVPRSVLDNVALGTKSIKQLEVLFDDLLGVRSLDAKISGVLGQNFLSQFNYLLNYRERHLEFETEGEMARRLKLARSASGGRTTPNELQSPQQTSLATSEWRLTPKSPADPLAPDVFPHRGRRSTGFG